VKSAYENLKERFAQMKHLENIGEILNKDEESVMAPGSADDRTQQTMVLATLRNALICDPLTAQWLDQAERDKANLSSGDRRNLFLMRRQWIHDACLPEELAAEIARVYNQGGRLHKNLKKTSDWGQIKDWYAHAFEVMRTIGALKKDKLGSASVYEALLDTFSPGLSDDMVAREFAVLEKTLPTLIREARQRQAAMPAPVPLTGHFPRAQQDELCRRVAKALGFDFSRGVLYIFDGHPSTGGSDEDTRITVGVDEANFLESVFTTVHETGHALYRQNLPKEWRYQPAGADLGMAIHESQSRIIEVKSCHTPEFFRYLEKEAREIFSRLDDPALAAENLERLLTQVTPSFVRVHADELTYPAHVILRHRLEKAIIEGTLAIEGLPKAWNDGMKNLLGITPPDHAQGCMQDDHWSCGYIGYFPAYTIGNMGAAQFFAAACRARPEIRTEIAKGNFTPLREWLRDNVHSKGSLLTTDELFIAATGEPLNAKYYLEHLSQRYLGRPWVAAPAPAAGLAGPAPA
jgi:carboxypeptidase Taq